MREPPACQRLQRQLWRAVGLLLAASAAMAEPDTEDDAIGLWLAYPPAARGAGMSAVAPPNDSDIARDVSDPSSGTVLTALNFLGVPYRRGGISVDDGFDCSGFTRHVFETSLGLLLPRRADEQARAPGLAVIQRDALKPGDLVFFNTLKRAFSHVGIYIGDSRFIHAPRPGTEVRVEDMRVAYWNQRYNGARRAGAQVHDTPASASAQGLASSVVAAAAASTNNRPAKKSSAPSSRPR